VISKNLQSMRPAARSLVVPILVAAVAILCALAAFAAGDINIHGGTGALLMLSAASVVAVALWEIVAVPWALVCLARHPGLRTTRNLAALGLACLYLIAAGVAYEYLTHIGITGTAHR
jgi:hypothetical protein